MFPLQGSRMLSIWYTNTERKSSMRTIGIFIDEALYIKAHTHFVSQKGLKDMTFSQWVKQAVEDKMYGEQAEDVDWDTVRKGQKEDRS